MAKSQTPTPGSRAPTDVDRVVGGNVRRLRLMRARTLSELADDLGISHQQLQKYETASNRLSAGMLEKVAGTLGVPIADLFKRGPAAPKASKAEAGAVRMEALQEEGSWLLAKAGSEARLLEMVEVLRVLARRA